MVWLQLVLRKNIDDLKIALSHKWPTKISAFSLVLVFQYNLFLKVKKLKVFRSQCIKGHLFMTPAKKVKHSDPMQQPSDVDHPSVLQWTIIVTLPPSKTDVSEIAQKHWQ